jgi:sn-glycerol 3-phosphate transport system substrate-binding protein
MTGRNTRLDRRRFLSACVALSAAACGGSRVPPGRQRASFWFSYGGRNRQTLEALIARFNSSQRRYYVDGVFQGDYFEGLAKVRTAIAAGAAPALSHVVGEVIPYLANAGVLEELDHYPGAADIDVVDALGQRGSYVGGDKRPLVALPFNRSTPIMYLNGAIFSQARLSAPKTWDELRQIAHALTVRTEDRTTRYGFGCPVNWWFWVALVGQAGGQLVEPDGTVSLGGPAGVRAIEFWQTLVREDRVMKLPPGRDSNDWDATNQDFLAGRVAMIFMSTAFLKYLEENARFPVVAAPLPANVRAAAPTGGTHFVMLKQAPAKEKAAAWEFLRWMLEPEQTIEWATRTGYMPVTRRAVSLLEKRGYYAAHPNDRVAYDQLSVAMQWPWSTELFRIQSEVVQPSLEEAVIRGVPASQVIARAQRLARGEAG